MHAIPYGHRALNVSVLLPAAVAPIVAILSKIQRHDKFEEDLEYFLG